jgi:hypothetical protein
MGFRIRIALGWLNKTLLTALIRAKISPSFA